MKGHLPYSFIYILRVWRDCDDDGDAEWRFAVEDTGTGQRHGFSKVAELTGFFESELRTDILANGDSVGG